MKPTDTSAKNESRLNILIAEDHKLIRKISRQILGVLYPAAVFYETDSVEGLIGFCKSHVFNLVILDIHLTDGNTLTVLPTVRTFQPETAILFFTMCPEDIYAKRVLHNGANGFLNKRADELEFKEAITTVLSGDRYISRKLQRQMADEVITKKVNNPFDRLSDREFEIMILLLQGKSLTEIGTELSIQVSTVGTHKTRLFDKLNVAKLMELSKVATAYGIIC
ncbi:MAG: response regulator transcription factor [Ferruginibacter sp.]